MRFQTISDACEVLPWGIIRTAMLAGGALRSYFDGSPVKDYDLFFRTPEEWREAVEGLLNLDPSFRPDPGTMGTLYPTFTHIPTGRLFNLIGFRTFPTPRLLAESFDFRCTAMAMEMRYPSLTFYGVPGADADCFNKELHFQNLQPTKRVARRLRRYVDELGYTATDDFIEKLVECSLVTYAGSDYHGE